MAPHVIEPIFYVYEHWRPDTGTCFWVGKGHKNRAREFRRRNQHHGRIVAKLRRSGFDVEVRIVRSQLFETEALAIEIERICLWRSRGVDLVNVTAGGEGVCGLRHSAETRAKIREKRRTQIVVHSIETRTKIGRASGAARKGKSNPAHSERMRGRKLPPEHRDKIVAKLIGRPVSEKTRDRIRSSNVGQVRSQETRERLRVAHLGKTPTDATREKMRTSQLLRWAKSREANRQWP